MWTYFISAEPVIWQGIFYFSIYFSFGANSVSGKVRALLLLSTLSSFMNLIHCADWLVDILWTGLKFWMNPWLASKNKSLKIVLATV